MSTERENHQNCDSRHGWMRRQSKTGRKRHNSQHVMCVTKRKTSYIPSLNSRKCSVRRSACRSFRSKRCGWRSNVRASPRQKPISCGAPSRRSSTPAGRLQMLAPLSARCSSIRRMSSDIAKTALMTRTGSSAFTARVGFADFALTSSCCGRERDRGDDRHRDHADVSRRPLGLGDGTMTHAAFSDDVISECLELRASALEHHYFEATVTVEMDPGASRARCRDGREIPGLAAWATNCDLRRAHLHYGVYPLV
jgi:hypothetical protein